MFQNGQKVVVVSGGDPTRVIKVQSASGTPDPTRYPIVDTTGVTGRDQQVQIVSGVDATRFPILRGVSDARGTADSVISALTPAAWYRNATGVTSAGGFASQWDDYSGNTRHLVQATGTNQPAYAAGVFTFDGADNIMVAAGWGLVQPETVIAVVRQDGWTNDDTLWDGTAIHSGRILQQTATPNLIAYAGASGINSNPDLAISSWGILAVVYNNASSSVRLNNNAAVTGTVGTNNMGGFRIGGNGGGDARYMACSYQEAIVFPTALSDTEQDDVITALNNALTVF